MERNESDGLDRAAEAVAEAVALVRGAIPQYANAPLDNGREVKAMRGAVALLLEVVADE